MRVILFLAVFSLLSSQSSPQQTAPPVQRDPQALALLQNSVRAMGANVPADSVATGNVVVVAGSLTSSGTVRILTRGIDQTSEQFTLPQSTQTVIYSRGTANTTDGANTQSLSLERTASCHSPSFPLPFLAAALANPDEALQYVGQETLGSARVQHLRIWNTFNSMSSLQFLLDFTVTDIWLDSSSALPVKLFYQQRVAQGAVPRIPVEVAYGDYRNLGGVLYPFQLAVSLNGTAWATITIQSVAFNNGLTDADFRII